MKHRDEKLYRLDIATASNLDVNFADTRALSMMTVNWYSNYEQHTISYHANVHLYIIICNPATQLTG